MPAPGNELAHGCCQNVGGGVAEHFERRGVAFGQKRHLGVGLDGTVEVPDRAVDARGQRRARQAGTDRGGELTAGGAARHLADTPVRQRQADHGRAHPVAS